MKKKHWQARIEENPTDVVTRLAYADWLLEQDKEDYASFQRYMVETNKVVGPPCVLEANKNERTWFTTIKANTIWGFPRFDSFGNYNGYNDTKIQLEWCIPHRVFLYLRGMKTHITLYRRDRGRHNDWALSWSSRQVAEDCLFVALLEMYKKGMDVS